MEFIPDFMNKSQTKRLKKFSFGSLSMLSSANAFGSTMNGGFGLLGAVGATRNFAALNIVKVSFRNICFFSYALTGSNEVRQFHQKDYQGHEDGCRF